jgi:hypothetical protein
MVVTGTESALAVWGIQLMGVKVSVGSLNDGVHILLFLTALVRAGGVVFIYGRVDRKQGFER